MDWVCIWVDSCTETDNLFKINEFKHFLHFPKSYNGNLKCVKHLTHSTSVSRREWTRCARIQKNIKTNQFMFNWNIHICRKLPDFWEKKTILITPICKHTLAHHHQWWQKRIGQRVVKQQTSPAIIGVPDPNDSFL